MAATATAAGGAVAVPVAAKIAAALYTNFEKFEVGKLKMTNQIFSWSVNYPRIIHTEQQQKQ